MTITWLLTLMMASGLAPPPPVGPGTDRVARCVADLATIDHLEVVLATATRDPAGGRATPVDRGRLVFTRTAAGEVSFLVETSGGAGPIRVLCDGRTLVVCDDRAGVYTSTPLPHAPVLLLDEPALTTRLGPAAVHLLGFLLGDDTSAFRITKPPRRADLGPREAWIVTCRSRAEDGPPGEVRLAFSTDSPCLPLGVAVMLPGGGVVELEYHDWSLAPVDGDRFRIDRLTAGRRRVATLPAPAPAAAVAAVAGADDAD